MVTTALVQFSGGVGSFFALLRAAERYGWENVVALFADVRMEDEDLYRFVWQVAEDLADGGGRLEVVCDGRTPWDVFFDERFLGNSLVDPCSRVLKRELMRAWIEANYPDPDDVVIVLGFDWTERHRFERAAPRWAPYRVEAPLCDPPFVEKGNLLRELKKRGYEVPRLYKVGGFSHNNCGGFCVKAGHKSMKRLLEVFPDRYAAHEAREQEIREYLDADVAILRHRSGPLDGSPLTMKTFREAIEADEHRAPALFDPTDAGACACVD